MNGPSPTFIESLRILCSPASGAWGCLAAQAGPLALPFPVFSPPRPKHFSSPSSSPSSFPSPSSIDRRGCAVAPSLAPDTGLLQYAYWILSRHGPGNTRMLRRQPAHPRSRDAGGRDECYLQSKAMLQSLWPLANVCLSPARPDPAGPTSRNGCLSPRTRTRTRTRTLTNPILEPNPGRGS